MTSCAPHEALHSVPMLWMDGWQPPELADVFLGGVEGVYGPQSAPLFRRWWIATTSEYILRAIHTLNSPKNYIRLLVGLSPIHSTSTCRRGAQGLMWGTRGPFPLAAAMVGYGCVGCWRLTSDQPTVGIVKIVYGSIFLFLRRSHTFFTSDPAAK